jgi:chemotaxis methyl-accepting protein methylase
MTVDFSKMDPDAREGLRSLLGALFRPLGRGGTARSLDELSICALERSAATNTELFSYLGSLSGDFPEVMKLWDLKAAKFPAEEGFFQDPTIFEAGIELIKEWATVSSDKKLRVLVLGAGIGHSTASLSMLLSGLSLKATGWDIAIDGLDLSPRNVKKAGEFLFTEAEVRNLPFPKLKWFQHGSGGLRFRANLGPPINHRWGDPFLSPEDHPENGLVDFFGKVDVLFCRYLSREAPDSLAKTLPLVMSSLLAEGGLAFTAPEEVWEPAKGISLENREGVFHYRKGFLKTKANFFFAPKKRVRGKKSAKDDLSGEASGGAAGEASGGTSARPVSRDPANGPERNEPEDPMVRSFLDKAEKAMKEGNLEEAVERAIEAAALAQETGRASAAVFGLLARLEKERGRPSFGKLFEKATELS